MGVSGRHFLQIPGPTNVPDRVLRAMDRPTIDHRGPAFAELGLASIAGLKRILRTTAGEAVIYPSSGTGAWEAAMVNTLSPGNKVLMVEAGQFASLWKRVAERIGLEPVVIQANWRRGADPQAIEDALRGQPDVKAVCVVQNETSTGCITIIPEIRAAIDAAGSDALLMVDTVSALGSMDMRMDEWRVDVVIGGSQKGLMLPPGLGLNGISPKALDAHRSAGLPRAYWDWSDMLAPNAKGYFPFTPATNLLFGLVEAVAMLEEQGLDAVFARHERHGEATRRAVQAWGLEVWCEEPRHYSPAVTTVGLPEGHSADALRALILKHFDMSLGAGLARLADRVFRIGHLGDFNDLMLMGTLSGVEMGLALAGVPHKPAGAAAAMAHLVDSARG